MKETAQRKLAMLMIIPRYPASITTKEMLKRLTNIKPEFNIGVRTVERNFNELCTQFPLCDEIEGRTKKWFWCQDAEIIAIPGMSAPTALAFFLAELYLEKLIPATIFETLEPNFNQARAVLEQSSSKALSIWRDKIRIVPPSQNLIAPRVDYLTIETIYSAVLDEKQITCEYKSVRAGKFKPYTIHPLGIVIKGNITYVKCIFDDFKHAKDDQDLYEDLALHRLRKATILDKPAYIPKGYKLADSINEHHFDYPEGPNISLKMRINEGMSKHLSESKLTHKQKITSLDNNEYLLEATVPNTLQLKWWLLGFGDQLVVEEPPELVKYFKDTTMNMAKRYQ